MQQWTIKISSPLFSIFSLAAILVGSRDHRTQFWKGATQGPFHQSLVTIGPVVSEALTNVLRYHTCRSSLREDRKLPITELKWDARTVTDIPGNNANWFFAFFGLTKDSRNKN